MATIRDVSKLAGVSVATVSRVLNRSGYVHEETERKVLRAIKELSYTPNFVARSLSNKKTSTIGLMVPDITNPFFPELARAVEDVMQLYGYTTILGNSDESVEKEKQYVEVLKQRYIDGVILASTALTADEVHKFGVPVVVLDRALTSDTIPMVTSKNREGAREATRFLLAQGCRKIAHLRGPAQLLNADERCQGYLDIVEQTDWFHPGLVVAGNYEMKQATDATLALLKKYPDIDGIFAGNDMMAIGALRAAQILGISIPDKLAIVGYDGITMGEVVYPELTTMAQPIYDMGALAARMLIKMIEKQPLDTLYYELDVQLIERGTTRKV
ncbi:MULTISPECIES: LacI family DNA-binding transcriptional regulator [Aneurinibacillus]|jgi:LacI family transcriptional regulator|uniref:LacI family transcriptional regulator n=1 Tax=Aneurinibacillus danicus TaxID=267746 RepID=A0A511V180_9BACL|nr:MULTISPECIES: LacI family DNA-binding transcriptional regulator [Aneurinibacillus]GEN32664.1 LacI family transcriptional regulator [Aneurinibacillus danicus]